MTQYPRQQNIHPEGRKEVIEESLKAGLIAVTTAVGTWLIDHLRENGPRYLANFKEWKAARRDANTACPHCLRTRASPASPSSDPHDGASRSPGVDGTTTPSTGA